jgi:copper transport protein
MTKAATLLLVALLAAAIPAAAHAQRLDTSPDRGERLQAAPAEVSITLSESIDPAGASLQVRNETGVRWDNDDLEVDEGVNPTLRVTMMAGAGNGSYLAYWSATSTVDGHPSSGTFGFAVGDFDAPAGSDSSPAAIASAWARALVYVGLALALAGAAFLWSMQGTPYDPALARRWIPVGAALHALGAAALLLATYFASAPGWGTFVGSEVGMQLAIRVGVALLAAFLVTGPVGRTLGRPGRVAAVALLLVAALMSARLGHLAAHGASRVAVDFAHLLFGGVWAGGLLLLLHYLTVRRPSDDDIRRVSLRFGTLALICVVGVAASGLVSSLAVLGRDAILPWRSWDEPYGRLLSAKVALTGIMVAVAAVNRFVLLRPGGPAWRLARSVAWEASVGAVVLVLAAFLATTNPPL